MNKKALIGVGAAVVCALGVITFLVARNAGAPDIDASPEPQAIASASPEVTASASPEASASPDTTASPEEEKVYTPTFMYFVSGADDGHDATMVMIDELKKEYGK